MLIAKDDAYHPRFRGRAAPLAGRAPRARRRRRATSPGFIRSIDYSTSAALERAPDLNAGGARQPRRRSCASGRERLSAAYLGQPTARRSATPRCGRPIADRAQASARLLPAGEGVLRNRIRTDEPAGLAARSARGTWRILQQRGVMPHEHAFARPPARSSRAAIPTRSIISARIARTTRPCVRVFLPERQRVVARRRRRRAANSPRIHDAGLFAGPVDGTRPHYRLRARFGDNEVELEDPYRFPPVLSDFDLYLLGEGNHLRALRQARRASDDARRRRGRRLRGVRAERAARQRGRRFQFLGRPAPRHARARQRLLGDLRARRARRRQIQIRDRRPRRRSCCR